MSERVKWPAELIEALAALEHERWAGWERYRAKAVTKTHHSGEINVMRWVRQRETAYGDLSEQEKESDRAEVRKTLAIMEQFGVGPAVEGEWARQWKGKTMNNPEGHIAKALECADDGSTDGAHHKMWVIDQMVRALTGCPMVKRTAIDCNGRKYGYEAQGESPEYLAWVKEFEAGEDGPQTYEWDTGIAP